MAIKSLAQTLKDLASGIKNTVTTVNKISDIMNIQSGLNPDGSSNGETPGTPTAGATDNTTDHSVIGDIKWSSADLTQAGFLVANGAEVGRATYPDLCAVYESMGFPWGAGDGSTTFNLPNLIGKFAEGADSAGGYHEAGLPNITGTTTSSARGFSSFQVDSNSAIYPTIADKSKCGSPGDSGSIGVNFDASRSNAIYGNSATVQPPSALLIPYVKAFAGASADSTDLAITELANDVARLSANLVGKNECKSYVVESVVNKDGSWYRKYSDGWIEQGGFVNQTHMAEYTGNITNFVKPFSSTSTIYSFHIVGFTTTGPNVGGDASAIDYREFYPQKMTNTSFFLFPVVNLSNSIYTVRYYAAGK